MWGRHCTSNTNCLELATEIALLGTHVMFYLVTWCKNKRHVNSGVFVYWLPPVSLLLYGLDGIQNLQIVALLASHKVSQIAQEKCFIWGATNYIKTIMENFATFNLGVVFFIKISLWCGDSGLVKKTEVWLQCKSVVRGPCLHHCDGSRGAGGPVPCCTQ